MMDPTSADPTKRVRSPAGPSERLVARSQDLNRYYEHVRLAYDRIATDYDASIGNQAVSARAKGLALDLIKGATPQGGRLLDVGCYTGVEALSLARSGFLVLGVDLSPSMVRLAQAKAKNWRLEDRVRFASLQASEISNLADDSLVPFDTVYSVYGTLNLEPRIGRFKRAMLEVLKPGGTFICGLLNPTVLYELLIAPLLLKFHGYSKLARQGVSTRIGLGSDRVVTYLYSPREFASLMTPEFRLEDARGLHIFYPPPRYRPGVRSNRWWVARAFDSIEAQIERMPPFSSLGFFSLLQFRRNER